MKRWTWVLVAFFILLWAKPAAAQNRFIVRTTGGLLGLQSLCLSLGCNVVGGLDGSLGQVFLVTTASGVDPNFFLTLLRSQLIVVNAELDQIVLVLQSYSSSPPSGLWDTTPVKYYGTTVWDGYVNQPAAQIIRLSDTQSAFHVSGAGIVADIDTGVDPTHPALQGLLLSGYDFTRNQANGSELTDFTQPPPSTSKSVAQVNQSTAAVLDQSTAAVLDGNAQYAAFGHGTMVMGIIHLVAPRAKLMPLKAFHADGTGYLSDILRAAYYAVQNHANIINMSFDISSYSQEFSRAINYANRNGVVCVASMGNDGKDELVYPAAFTNYVMGIASTSNQDQRSTFSNYGQDLVWMAAPGEAIITTYPFGTYAAGWGTSFSAPLASGGAALLLNVQADCGEYQASQALAHAKWISSDLNHGRLDLYQAVSAWIAASGVHE